MIVCWTWLLKIIVVFVWILIQCTSESYSDEFAKRVLTFGLADLTGTFEDVLHEKRKLLTAGLVDLSFDENIRNISAMCTYEDFSILVSWDGSVFGFGLNQQSSLTQTLSSGLNPKASKIAHFDDFVDVKCGTYHVLVQLSDSVMGWGGNSYSQLLDGSQDIPSPALVYAENNTQYVVSGGFHSLIVRKDGSVWCRGRNDFHQCSDGSVDKIEFWKLIPFDKKVKMASAGTSHTLFLTENGNLYAMGDNSRGQCGQQDPSVFPMPVLIEFKLVNQTIDKISSSHDHNLFGTSSGLVFAFGSNEFGESGNGNLKDVFHPQGVIGLPEITIIATGRYHSLFSNHNYENIYGIGRNINGELGIGTDELFKSKVHRIFFNEYVVTSDKVLGIAASSSHSLILTSGGRFCFGSRADDRRVCTGNGTCVDEDLCHCDKKGGSRCDENVCYARLESDGDVCSGQGKCVDWDTCICFQNFTGAKCQYPKCFGHSSIDKDACSQHGLCVGVNVCECTEGESFGGPDCSIPLCYGTLATSKSVCGTHGTCSSPDNCRCNYFFSGPKCDRFLLVYVLLISLVIIFATLFGILFIFLRLKERRSYTRIL